MIEIRRNIFQYYDSIFGSKLFNLNLEILYNIYDLYKTF